MTRLWVFVALVLSFQTSVRAENFELKAKGEASAYSFTEATCELAEAKLKIKAGDEAHKNLGYLSITILNFRTVIENSTRNPIEVLIDHSSKGQVEFTNRLSEIWISRKTEAAPTRCALKMVRTGQNLEVTMDCENLQDNGMRESFEIKEHPLKCVMTDSAQHVLTAKP